MRKRAKEYHDIGQVLQNTYRNARMNGHEDYWTGNNASDREDLNPLCSFALSLGLDQHGLRKRLENLEKLTLSLVPVVPEPPVIEALRSTDV